MREWQFSLSSLLLIAAAVPIWLWLIVFLPQGPGWGVNPIGFIVAPLVLCGVTAAIHRMLRQHRNGWAISALLAGLIVTSILLFVASLVG
jgi:hypothetical protein